MTEPANALDPLTVVATNLHSSPGVFALLLGSGVSTGAGMQTAWGVVKELVRRYAGCHPEHGETAADEASADPEAWWASHGEGPLTYSSVLAALGGTQAARRDLLKPFFEASPEEADAGQKVPSAAHGAVAELVRLGLVRVIITTNFDRLLERALDAAGIPPQVITRPDQVAAMEPLAHARVTVIKLHGDYLDLDTRNTIDELDTYPEEWSALLRRISSEYGLLVCGWSGESDTALVRELENTPRRYPLFWDSRSAKGEAATRLIAQHRGKKVASQSADELFTGVIARVEALARLSEPPLTTAMAISRLKQMLPDPVRRIELHDLVMQYADGIAERAQKQHIYDAAFSWDLYEQVLAAHAREVAPLIHLAATGIQHDRPGAHDDIWVAALQRLMQTRPAHEGTFNPALEAARHYPALLFLRATLMIAASQGRDALPLTLLRNPIFRSWRSNNAAVPAAHALHDLAVLSPDHVNLLPRWQGTKWLYPVSHLVRSDLREVLRDWLREDDEYQRAADQAEYLHSVVIANTQSVPGSYRILSGEFVGEWRWHGDPDRPVTEDWFIEMLRAQPETSPWAAFLGKEPEALSFLESMRGDLQRVRRYG